MLASLSLSFSLSNRILPLLLGLALAAVATDADAKLHLVRNGEQIQDAIDAANPGDTIYVLPGVYRAPYGQTEYVARVEKSDLTLIGSRRAVIDATGIEYGIMVGQDEPIGPQGCPPITVQGFRLRGFTFQNAADTGVRLSGVQDYQLLGGIYRDNEEYGPFPICSRNGLIAYNHVSGHNDAGIYVGDDQNTRVLYNVATDNVVGAEIENSRNSIVRHNWFSGNAGGLLIFVGPNLPQPFNEDVDVSHNFIFDNNRANTGDGAVAGVPEGTGILLFGSDRVTIEHNFILGNDSFGFASIGNFNVAFDPRIEPFNDDLVVRNNFFSNNGANPDPLRALTPGVDIVFIPDAINPQDGSLIAADPDPSDNCFAQNSFTTEFPEGITSLFPCP